VSLEVLTAWRTHLGDLGALSSALQDAIQRDDVLGAIAATMQLRRTRAAIARVEAPGSLRYDRAELDAMASAIAELPQLKINARAAELAMHLWLTRPLPGDDRLLRSPLGIAVLADAMLPEVWDFEADVAVLVGRGLSTVAEVLSDLGQRRIVVVAGDAPVPGDAIAVASIDEAVVAVRMMVPGPPSRLVVRATASVEPAMRDEAVDKLRNALADLRIHRNTVCEFSRTWVEQGVANLPAIARWPSIAALGDRFAGLPMVIAAPGPSLARNVEQLRGLAGRAIVTAFSHSLRPLVAAGVVPDLVVTVDPQDVRYHFAGCDLSRMCLVNAATVHPALFELPAQRFLTLSANSAIDDWIFDGCGEDAVVPGGGSVATSAFSLAVKWGCDPIIFVGLDLSFAGGAYYVATSSDGEARAEVDDRGVIRVRGWSEGFRAMKAAGGPGAPAERAIELPGWSGGTVPSSFMFSMFHRWFVTRLRELAAQGTAVTAYNCTEGGAFIEGMEHRPLAEVLAALDREVDVAGELDAAAMTVDATRGARLVDHVTGFVRGLRRGRRLATVARKLIARGSVGPRLANIERSLAQTLEPLTIASLLAQREVERAHDVARRDASEADYLTASASLFDTVLAVTGQLEPALRVALMRLASQGNRGRAA
jgi:hypothetical protein